MEVFILRFERYLLLMTLLCNLKFAYQGKYLRFLASGEANQVKSISQLKARVEVRG